MLMNNLLLSRFLPSPLRWLTWKLTISTYYRANYLSHYREFTAGTFSTKRIWFDAVSDLPKPSCDHSLEDTVNTLYTVIHCSSLLCAASCRQMVPRQPARQAAPQCSLNSSGTCANAFSQWPLLSYLIIQNSVNLNLITVCHGEAHWACVGSSSSQSTQQLARCYLRSGTRWWQGTGSPGAAHDLLLVRHSRKPWHHALVTEYRVGGRYCIALSESLQEAKLLSTVMFDYKQTHLV